MKIIFYYIFNIYNNDLFLINHYYKYFIKNFYMIKKLNDENKNALRSQWKVTYYNETKNNFLNHACFSFLKECPIKNQDYILLVFLIKEEYSDSFEILVNIINKITKCEILEKEKYKNDNLYLIKYKQIKRYIPDLTILSFFRDIAETSSLNNVDIFNICNHLKKYNNEDSFEFLTNIYNTYCLSNNYDKFSHSNKGIDRIITTQEFLDNIDYMKSQYSFFTKDVYQKTYTLNK